MLVTLVSAGCFQEEGAAVAKLSRTLVNKTQSKKSARNSLMKYTFTKFGHDTVSIGRLLTEGLSNTYSSILNLEPFVDLRQDFLNEQSAPYYFWLNSAWAWSSNAAIILLFGGRDGDSPFLTWLHMLADLLNSTGVFAYTLIFPCVLFCFWNTAGS